MDEKFIKNGYSILTTPKYDWYESINGEKDWYKTQNLVIKFWKEFQNLKDGVFSNIIFPILPMEVKEEVKNFIMNLNNIASIKFIECTFEDKIDFSEIEFKAPLDFSKTIFKEDINFEGSTFNNLSFNKVDFRKDIFLKYKSLKRIRIEETKFEGNLFFSPNQNEKQKIDEIYFQKVTFSNNSSIQFQNFNLDRLVFENINNISQNIIFSNIEIDYRFFILDSVLGSMEFNNIIISSIKHFNIRNSSISLVKFNNFDWCNISDIKTNRDGFRQLKMALNKSHDYATAHIIHSYEMYRYYKELYKEFFKFNKNDSNNIKNSFLFLEKKILLLLSYKISIFSQSWLMPIIWILIFHSIFSFFISLVLLDTIMFSSIFIVLGYIFSSTLNRFETTKLTHLISIMFIFIIITFLLIMNNELFRAFLDGMKFYYSPVHKINENYEILLWFLNKFILSILTYHLIISLRRPTKA